MVRHAYEIDWMPLAPEVAKQKRRRHTAAKKFVR
jgi:hypothetical protein